MSVNRSNSQVRNLMAVFEKNNSTATAADSTSPDRGRSNGHLSPGPNGERPLSKVRSSFVSVETPAPSQAMEIDPEKTKQEHVARQESSAGLRRQSFSTDETADSGLIANMRKTISREEERRDSNPVIAETIPEAAIEATPAATTPAVEAKDYMAAGEHTTDEKPQSKLRDVASTTDEQNNEGDVANQAEDKAMTLPDDDMPADNPDKPVSGVQAEPGPMQPSDLKERSAVSPQPSEDTNQAESSQPTPAQAPRARRGTVTEADVAPATITLPHRPAAISTGAPEPSSANAQPKTPTSAKKTTAPARQPSATKSSAAKSSSTLSPKPPVKKPSRTSLTQAKSKPESKPEPSAATKSKSPQSKPARPRSPTRPIKISSHLTAPTASSAAKHDAQSSKPATSSAKPAAPSRPQPRTTAVAAKPAPRSAAASSSAAPKKAEARPAASTKAPDEGFLARMMRPTASSASKVHDKPDVKSPPKRTPSVIKPKGTTKPKMGKLEKPHTNGTKPSSSTGAPVQSTEQDSHDDLFKTEDTAGASTPQAASGAQEQEADSTGLEATPAFDSATIR